LPNEPPPAPQKKSKKPKKSKSNETDPQLPSDSDITNHRTVLSAAFLWVHSDKNDVDFGPLADQTLEEKSLSPKHRLHILNDLVLGAWKLLSEEEQKPFLELAEKKSADRPLA
jgi:hypothetical protein